MKWCRLYDEMIDDPKILALSLSKRWHFVELLCIANRQIPRGSLPDTRTISLHMRIRISDATSIIRQMISLGFVDEDPETKGLKIHGWNKRQFESDDTTARTSISKERSRERSQEQPKERSREQHGNVPRVRDSETDSEKREKPEGFSPPLTHFLPVKPASESANGEPPRDREFDSGGGRLEDSPPGGDARRDGEPPPSSAGPPPSAVWRAMAKPIETVDDVERDIAAAGFVCKGYTAEGLLDLNVAEGKPTRRQQDELAGIAKRYVAAYRHQQEHATPESPPCS